MSQITGDEDEVEVEVEVEVEAGAVVDRTSDRTQTILPSHPSLLSTPVQLSPSSSNKTSPPDTKSAVL